MARSRKVESPDGDRWLIRVRWLDRPRPSLRRSFGRNRKRVSNLVGSIDAVEVGDGPAAGFVVLVGGIFVVFVLLPFLGVAVELIAVLVLLTSGIVGRLLLGRPWTVEAVDLDDARRSTAYAVKDWRSSRAAVDELARAVATAGSPVTPASGVAISPPARRRGA